MAACPSCGAEGIDRKAACPSCGARVLPELELAVRAAPAAKAPRPKKEVETSLELAIDPRVLITERRSSEALVRVPADAEPVVLRRESVRPGRARSSPPLAVGDLTFDARLLADYGPLPKHWFLTPFYAWRVLRRRRELASALAGQRAQAARAKNEAEDALVAFADATRAIAEKQPAYAPAIEELQRAEELLRSRDHVLASEQDAQNARLLQVNTRLNKLHEELLRAQAAERNAAGELAAAQAGLAREEAKLKRAEIELRTVRQRESSGEADG